MKQRESRKFALDHMRPRSLTAHPVYIIPCGFYFCFLNLNNPTYFLPDQVIGSSLLFVHDHSGNASIWMIDFGKTTPVPDRRELLHNVPWTRGSREDGYMIGLNSLIVSLGQAISVASLQQQGDSGAEKMLPEVH